MDEKWILTDLHMRLDKLEQEIQWTREMIDIIQEDIDAQN
jgi:phosphoglycerate-specific signal transduction histidine kinase